MTLIPGRRRYGTVRLLTASIFIYIVSFGFPAYWSWGWRCGVGYSGWDAFQMAFAASLEHLIYGLIWSANLFLWAGWVLLGCRSHALAGVMAASAFAAGSLGPTAMVMMYQPHGMEPGGGYFLWLGSMAVAAFAPFLPKGPGPRRPAYPVSPTGPRPD
jgi:hypothetical protein